MLTPRTRRPLVFTAVILAMFMAAIEATIIATSMPTIVARLGDMPLYSWVFSSYLLMQAVSVPIYGKLSDLFGRKRVFLFGLSTFLASSVLCGLAQSMSMLVAFRFLQGLGAGAVQPLAMTLIGDLYEVEERARVQAYVSSVWGISSIVGPMSGALIVQYLDWAWVFWINVPFAVAAIVIVSLYLHEEVERKRPHIDYAGAGFLLAGLSVLMLMLTHIADLTMPRLLGLMAIVGLAAVLFIRQEQRAREPMISLSLWKTPLVAVANSATLVAGIAMIGILNYLPTFIQGVLGTSAMVAGLAVSAMSIGWPLASLTGGRLLMRVGSRKVARAGGIALFFGSLILALFANAGVMVAAAGAFVLGMGMGLLHISFLISIQSSVPWSQRGAATASYILMRILGSAIGSAIFGGMLNYSLQRYLDNHALTEQVSIADIQSLLDGARAGHAIGEAATENLRAGLSYSLHWVLWGVFLAAVVTLVIAWSAKEMQRSAESEPGSADKQSSQQR